MSNQRKSARQAPSYSQPLRTSSEIMRALAHPLRLRILSFIDERESACVTDIHAGLGIEQSLVSQHLRVLRQAELVTTSRSGKFVYYGLDYERLASASHVAHELEIFAIPDAEVEI